MAEITKDDIQRAVQDSMRDMANNVSRIRDQVSQIDRRTDDLDESQREIRDQAQRIQQFHPQLEALTRAVEELNRMRGDVEDVKLRTQNIERGLQQITEYLQAQHEATQEERSFKRE